MIGKTYLLRGEPVVVLARWRNTPTTSVAYGVMGVTPRNVLIRHEDGRKIVRPFRGLRVVR